MNSHGGGLFQYENNIYKSIGKIFDTPVLGVN